MTSRRAVLAAGVVVAVLTGCTAPNAGRTVETPPADRGHSAAASGSAGPLGEAPARKPRPLRPGERRLTVSMTEPYTPSAPTGVGTDDYRCFLLDPRLDDDVFVTGTDVRPGNPRVVHHVILFRVPPGALAATRASDVAEEGPGWTCFGGMGVAGQSLHDAPWLGAWAPGGSESVLGRDYGIWLVRGSAIVMQVHYNLLAGAETDLSATRLRIAPAPARLRPVRTLLLPAPVELPCRPGRDAADLCDRTAAVADVKARFGEAAGSTADFLHLLCASPVRPGSVQSCTRGVGRPATILGAAGHMHLLGRRLRIDLNPGTPRARTILKIQRWNFDDQSARPVGPIRLRPSDTVRVTCQHRQWLRDRLPELQGQPERYVLWGEGTSDEMCLGILQVTRP